VRPVPVEGVKPASDEVGIHEMNDTNLTQKKFPGKSGLPGAIWSGNDNAAGGSNDSGAHG
jgi:hypothetical protein